MMRLNAIYGAPPRRLWAAFLQIVLLGALGTLIQGCAMTGDFGRPKKSTVLLAQVYEGFTDYILNEGTPSFYKLTAGEIRMRETARRLRMAVHAPISASFIPHNEGGFSNYLAASGQNFGPSRLSYIDDEIIGDEEALTRFSQAARQVLLADRRRLVTLADGSPNYSQADADNSINRVQENYAFMEGTFDDLDIRIVAYATAIDRTKLETPAVSAVSIESSLIHLRERALALRYEITAFYEASMMQFGRPPPHPPYGTMKPALPPPPPLAGAGAFHPPRVRGPW